MERRVVKCASHHAHLYATPTLAAAAAAADSCNWANGSFLAINDC